MTDHPREQQEQQQTVETKVAPSNVPLEPRAFAVLGVRPSILRGLAEAQFETPSEIQALLIPRALAGVDLLGQARTGTGKTAAFGIPILQRSTKGVATQAIILVPTRELCIQVDTELKRLGQHTPIRVVPVYGGQKISAQMKFLKHGPEIVVGTPGRVMDLLERRIINFNNVRFVVLDEVDRMLDIGFRDDIRRILSRVKGQRKNAGMGDDAQEPSGGGDEGNGETADAGSAVGSDRHHQTIFVSATISGEIERLARTYMREPVEKLIAPGADEKPTVEEVEQYFLSVQPWDKYRLLKALLERENPDLAIVFCKTKHGAQKLAKRLHADGIECREIHGNLAQNKRDRVMKSFRGGKFDVLVATDLASRGIDVADISHIVNFDIPDDPEVYVHRVGRTARMGASGKAFTFVSRDQGELLTKVESLINMIIPQTTVENFNPNPQPSDWTDAKPGGPGGAPAGVGAGAASADPAAAHPSVPLPPPRSLGARIPITRRHRRRR
ncbi:MAG TPA: DEAD/DEAH box helicase [Tepidisphaeraceae bacterium]|jgi:ATP-dependent RNA helicase DeaD